MNPRCGTSEYGQVDPVEILETSIAEYRPRYVLALFSGGHDSLVAAHVASRHKRFGFAVHIDTGIGVEQTREFVRSTCRDWGIHLRECKATEYRRANGSPDPQVYAEVVQEYGFPGPAMHRSMYRRLKERPLRQLLRELTRDPSDRVILVTGIRASESKRRMAHAKPIQAWEGTKIWVAPIWQFAKSDVEDYIKSHGLKRNPVVDCLHMSGECLCGAFARPGELEEIRFWYPEIAAKIDTLERLVKERGFPWGWGEKPQKWWQQHRRGQLFLKGIMPDIESILCNGCGPKSSLDSHFKKLA